MGSVIHSYVTNSMVKGVRLDIRKFELVASFLFDDIS